MFNGATINNLLDGSFFTSGSFMQNAMSIINNILGTLFQKLDYIVGFNLSGTLANYLGGFSSYARGLTYIGGASANNRLPDILTRGGDADSRIREYFRYKGTNVKMVGRAPTNLAGGAIYGPIDYSTSRPSLSGEKSEYVEVHRNLFNNLYADFANDLKAATILPASRVAERKPEVERESELATLSRAPYRLLTSLATSFACAFIAISRLSISIPITSPFFR
jgi:hypothetical protein